VTIAGVLYFCLLANDESEKQVRGGREGRRQGKTIVRQLVAGGKRVSVSWLMGVDR
jgi:hypothetical protein